MARRTGQDVGKEWEKTLQEVFSFLSEHYVFSYHKLVDTGAAGNIVQSQPADYLISYRGQLNYLEAKASTTAKNFRPSMLRPKQRQTIIRESILGSVPYYILFGDLKGGNYMFLDAARELEKKDNGILFLGPIEDLADDMVNHFFPVPIREALLRSQKIIDKLR